MSISRECVSSIKDLVGLFWDMLSSGQLKPLIWLACGTITLTRLLRKIRVSEADDLAAALVVGLICAIVIAASESQVVPSATTSLRQCAWPESKVALVRYPDASRPRQGS
jgi:hypothetical protein